MAAHHLICGSKRSLLFLAVCPASIRIRSMLLRSGLQPTQTAAIRVAAASVVEKAKLDRQQLLALAGMMRSSGPLELSRLLPAFDQGSDEALGLELVAASKQSKARSSVRAECFVRAWRSIRRVRSEGGRGAARVARRRRRQAGAASRGAADVSQGGDIRRGQAVFNSRRRRACPATPSATWVARSVPISRRIGQVRSERELLEAIVFPSASFARGFEPVVVTTEAGETHSGVVRSDLTDAVVLATAAGAEIRILRRDIVDMQPRDGIGHAAGPGRAADAPGTGRSGRVSQGDAVRRALISSFQPVDLDDQTGDYLREPPLTAERERATCK